MSEVSAKVDAVAGDAAVVQGTGVAISDARKSRKAVFRRTIDYNASAINYLKERISIHKPTDRLALQPDYLWSPKLLPPKSYLDCPMNCVMSKPVRTSTNKNKCPIYCVCWTPEGRRLITGAYSGEFTLWNGLTFNFETILQAHESQIRCMKWSHNEEWLLTADHSGYVKYWQANMNNVEMYQAHKEPIRGVSFCPFDCKFVTCSDDSTVRIWDFHRCAEERVLRGHGSDVRSVAWHPTLSLIISGSKDAQQPIKLWDPKTGESVTTLYIHKNTCTDVSWNDNGNWFLTASRDHLVKLFDLRNLKSELQTFRGHKRDVMRVAWHPFHECLFASGSADGSIFFWLAGTDTELGAVEHAHESMIWSLAWHPFGHILVSGANDFATKFWTRNRPGDILKDSVGSLGADTLLQSTGLAHMAGDSELVDQLTNNMDLLKSLVESAQSSAQDLDEQAFVTNPDEINAAVEIPGLNEGPVVDLNVTDVDEAEERDRNKMRGTRMIPKDFVANWASTRITAMPTVMMAATPSPSQLAAAAAVAAAAVNDLTVTPQYLPPVKPAVPPTAVAKGTEKSNTNASTDGGDRDKSGRMSKFDRTKGSGDAPRSGRGPGTAVMNYLGQPPPEESMPILPPESQLPPPPPQQQPPMAVPAQPPLPTGPRPDWKEPCGNWNSRPENFMPQPPLNGPNVHAPMRHPYPEREPFSDRPHEPFNPEQAPLGAPIRHSDEFNRMGRSEDRDYRDYSDNRDPPSRAANDYYNRPGQPPNNNFNSVPHPSEKQQPPVGDLHGRHFVPPQHPPPPPQHSYEHRASEHFPPRETPHPPYPPGPGNPEPWGKPWTEGHQPRQDGFGYPTGPPNRFPPPHDVYRSPPGAPHDPNFFPPQKRAGPPPPPLPPDHVNKYPRADPPWNQW